MKKGRAGVQLTLLAGLTWCPPCATDPARDHDDRAPLRLEQKSSLAREFTEVQTPWGPVQIKIARWPSGEWPMPRGV